MGDTAHNTGPLHTSLLAGAPNTSKCKPLGGAPHFLGSLKNLKPPWEPGGFPSAGAGLSLERLLGPGGIPAPPEERQSPQCPVHLPRRRLAEGRRYPYIGPHILALVSQAAWLRMESRHPLPGHPQQSGRKWAGHGGLAQERGFAEGAGPGLGQGRSWRGQAEDLRLRPQPETWCEGTETGLSQATSSERGQGVARTHWAAGPRDTTAKARSHIHSPKPSKGREAGRKAWATGEIAGLTWVSPPPPVAPNASETQCLTAPSPSDHKAQQRPQRSNLTWESPPHLPPSGPQVHALP